LAVKSLGDLESVRAEISDLDYLQAPLWPAGLDADVSASPGPIVTTGDYLASTGFRSSSAIRHVLRAWDGLFSFVRPAVVVANYSPGALLAARARVPNIAVGEGFTLPPPTMECFPPIEPDASQPRYNERDLLQLVNDCLLRTQRPILSHFPQVYAADRSCVASFSELDPYARHRLQPNAGPWTPVWDLSTTREPRELFCYFSIPTPFQLTVVRALQEIASSGIPVRVHMPHLLQEHRAALEEIGVVAEPKPLPFEEIQRSARLVVSLGSLSFLSCALAAGIPQFVLPAGPAMRFAGSVIAGLGVGGSSTLDGKNPLEVALLAQVLTEAYGNERYAQRARELAPDFTRRLHPRPEEVVADLVDELV
jgi:hypothetical protein